MTDKFNKILDHVTGTSDPRSNVANVTILGYDVAHVASSPALQDKLYDIFFPPQATPTGIRTMGVEDIRSRG